MGIFGKMWPLGDKKISCHMGCCQTTGIRESSGAYGADFTDEETLSSEVRDKRGGRQIDRACLLNVFVIGPRGWIPDSVLAELAQFLNKHWQ